MIEICMIDRDASVISFNEAKLVTLIKRRHEVEVIVKCSDYLQNKWRLYDIY